MKTIRFDKVIAIDPGYAHEIYTTTREGAQSDEYVQKDVAEKLVEALRELMSLECLEDFDPDCDCEECEEVRRAGRKAQAALALADGE